MANSAKDGEVLYTIRADDSQLDSDLDAAEKKVRKSSEETAEKSEQEEKKSANVKKKVKEDVTEHHRKENEKQEQSDEESHDKREESAKSHGETLKNIASGTAKAIGTGMLAAGAAVVGIGVSAVSSANDMDKAMNQFVASTGKGTEETERYKKVMEEIYSNNYGDSFEDIGQAMADVTQKLGDLDDVTLQKVTESAFALRDTFGYEIPESTRAAKAMVDNFGISGEQAMNLIAAGAQNGLDYSGELLDSISEYSVQFAKVGLDADDMFKIFQKGAESGAFNLDKVGDAVKEMAIRVVDGSDTTAQGFELIGLNADEMAAKFAAGGDSAKEAFNQTIEALAGLEDPLAQNTAGVDLFGTMWEDLGPEAVTALADIQEGAYDTAGAMEQIKDIKYDDIGSVFEGLKRSIEVLIVPLGEQLIPLLAELIDEVLESRHSRIPVFEENIDNIIGVLHVKDVMIEMRKSGLEGMDIRGMLHEPFFVPETKEADELFRSMQETRHHMAILVDEYGGFSGIVTIEDLVEEIMGDINEEYEEVVPEIVPVNEDEYVLDGGILIEDLNEELGLKLETENYDTLSGYLIEQLGHIPAKEDRDVIESGNLVFAVEEVKDNRITQVRLKILPAPEPEDETKKTK